MCIINVGEQLNSSDHQCLVVDFARRSLSWSAAVVVVMWARTAGAEAEERGYDRSSAGVLSGSFTSGH